MLPFKASAWRLAEVITERAETAQAVNTICLDQRGELHGDNTDGVGLIKDIMRNNGFKIHCKRLLILGEGGAV